MHKSQQQTVSLLEHETAAGGSDSCSSNSSFTDSYSDSSDLANWEEYVAEDGSLFYAEYLPHRAAPKATAATPASTTNVSDPPLSDGSPERQVEFRGRSLLRMGKKPRRPQQPQQSQQQQHHDQNQQQQQQTQAQFLFSRIKSNSFECKQIELTITARERYRFGRRSTAVESILGFRAVGFPDQPECLMVDELVHDMPVRLQSNEPIKRGDWFKSLDDIEVRAGNVDDLLLQFTEPTKVRLKFQGLDEPKEAENTALAQSIGNTLQKVTDFNSFATTFEILHLGDTSTTIEPAEILPFAMMIIPPECSQLDEHKDSFFCYPEDTNLNFLYKARGSFLTLNAVLSEELHTPPLLSKLLVKDVEYFVTYRKLNSLLVLFAFSGRCQTMKEATMRTEELMRYLKSTFPTLHITQLAPTGSSEIKSVRLFLHNFAHVQHVRVLSAYRQQSVLFEELLPESRCMPLPKEAQLRILDALSEMEAMDYRNWNDEPLNTHREFFIHGSVLYYEHFMLVSQMTVQLREQVDVFLRCRGIFDLVAGQKVKELYVWQEIKLSGTFGRHFLAICGRGHLILAAILKIFDAMPESSSYEKQVPPSLFYIEEIQETLDHLIQCGIESLAMFWAVSNKRPEILEKLHPHDAAVPPERNTRKFETLLKQKLIPKASAISISGSQSAGRSSSCDEEAHLCSSLGGSSIHSEDDCSKKRTADGVKLDDSGSDDGSDWEDFTAQNLLPGDESALGQAEMNESLCREIKNVVPVKISPGWRNSIYYYIYIDNDNGTIFCPVKGKNNEFPFMREMRRALHTIHDELQATRRRREKRSQNAEERRRKGTGDKSGGKGGGVESSCGDVGGDASGSNSKGSRSGATGSSRGTGSSGCCQGCGGDCEDDGDDDKDYGEATGFIEQGMTITVREKIKESKQTKETKDSEEEDTNRTKGAIKGRFAVAGRIFTSPAREIYICHRPDVSQNMVELAFRLSFFTVG